MARQCRTCGQPLRRGYCHHHGLVLDFRSQRGAERFWRCVPVERQMLVDGQAHVVSHDDEGVVVLEPVTVQGTPLAAGVPW